MTRTGDFKRITSKTAIQYLKPHHMKKILLLIVLLLPLYLAAQNYRWADSAAVWHHTYNWIGLPGYQKTVYTGDTLINNKWCQRFFSTAQQAWPQPTGNPIVGPVQGINVCYLYKSNDSVFTLRNNQFHLAFKTNASVGEIWDLGPFMNFFGTYQHAYVKVTGVAQQSYAGIPLRNISVMACKANGDSIEWMSTDTALISYYNIINEKFGPLGGFTTINQVSTNNIIDETMPQYLLCYSSADFPFLQFGNSDCFNGIFTSLAPLETHQLKIFPNPAREQVTVFHAQGSDMRIADAMGKIHLQKKLQSDTEQIDISALPAGLYFIGINEHQTKLIKQ